MINPKSLKNLKRGQPKSARPKQKVLVSLDPETVLWLRGKNQAGSISLRIEHMVAKARGLTNIV